jgi:hypothetical protein
VQQGQLLASFAGVTVLILALNGSLGRAWNALLGHAPSAGAGAITPSGGVLCHFSLTNTDRCDADAASCIAAGGTVRQDTQGTCGPAQGEQFPQLPVTQPSAGAPGSGITTV